MKLSQATEVPLSVASGGHVISAQQSTTLSAAEDLQTPAASKTLSRWYSRKYA